MCLALPHRIVRLLAPGQALAEGPDGERVVSTQLVGEVAPGAYVVVAYGAAIREVEPAEAEEILELWGALTDPDALADPDPPPAP